MRRSNLRSGHCAPPLSPLLQFPGALVHLPFPCAHNSRFAAGLAGGDGGGAAYLPDGGAGQPAGEHHRRRGGRAPQAEADGQHGLPDQQVRAPSSPPETADEGAGRAGNRGRGGRRGAGRASEPPCRGGRADSGQQLLLARSYFWYPAPLPLDNAGPAVRRRLARARPAGILTRVSRPCPSPPQSCRHKTCPVASMAAPLPMHSIVAAATFLQFRRRFSRRSKAVPLRPQLQPSTAAPQPGGPPTQLVKDTAFALCVHCLRDQDTAFALCVHCLRGKDTAICFVFPLSSWPRHCHLLCVFTAFVAKTLPLPCVSTAFVAMTLPWPCGLSGGERQPEPRVINLGASRPPHFSLPAAFAVSAAGYRQTASCVHARR